MKKRIWVIFLGLLCVVSLSGCKYMRLLQFKSQFQNFAKYFVFIKSPTKPGFRCLHPLLIPDDILLLSDGVSPSVVKTTEGVTTWAFVMKKDAAPSDIQPSVLTISLEFNAKNQLTSAFYPSQFSAIFHPDFVPQLLERMGDARVDVSSKGLEGEKAPFPEEWIPDRHKIAQHLGEPTSEIVSNNETRLSYTYTLEGASRDVNPYIMIAISPLTQKALWVQTTVFGFPMTMRLR